MSYVSPAACPWCGHCSIGGTIVRENRGQVMSPLSRHEFEQLLRGRSQTALSAFVADLWAARGWETTVEDGVVVANRNGREQRILVYPEPDLLRFSRPSVKGSYADIIVAARDDAPGPKRLVCDADATLLEPTDLYDFVLYGIDRDVSDSLLRRHFGRGLTRPDDGEQTLGERFHKSLSQAGAATLAGAALVILLVLVMTGNVFLEDRSPSSESPLATPVSPVPVSESDSEVRHMREVPTSTVNTRRWDRVIKALQARDRGGPVKEIARLPFYGMPNVLPAGETAFYIVEPQGLFRIDIVNGDRWRFTVPGIIFPEVIIGPDAVYLTFLPDETTVSRPVLVAINETSAIQQWSFLPEEGAVSLPALTDTMTYVSTTDGTVYALNKPSGDLRWRTGMNGTVATSPVVQGSQIYVWTLQGSVNALDADSGAIRWQAPGNDSPIASFHARNGTTYVTRLNGVVTSRDATNGNKRWRVDIGEGIATASVRCGAVFVAMDNGTVFGLDAASGRVSWRVRTSGGRLTPLTVSDRTVYVGTNYGTIHAINASTGRKRWQFPTNAPVAVHPVIDDGHLYLANTAGEVYALNPEDGAKRWQASVGHRVVFPPRVINGVVLVSTSDRKVHVLAPVGNKSAVSSRLREAT